MEQMDSEHFDSETYRIELTMKYTGCSVLGTGVKYDLKFGTSAVKFNDLVNSFLRQVPVPGLDHTNALPRAMVVSLSSIVTVYRRFQTI